jgi:hypothetical protein
MMMGYSPSSCINYIAKNYSQPNNPRLEVYMIAMLFKVQLQHVIPNVEHLLSQAEKNFDSFDDPLVKCELQNPYYNRYADWNIHRHI